MKLSLKIMLLIGGAAIALAGTMIFTFPATLTDSVCTISERSGGEFMEEDFYNAVRTITLIYALIMVVIYFIIALVLSASIAKPINHFTGAIQELIDGAEPDIPELERRDDIGKLAQNFSLIAREVNSDRKLLDEIFAKHPEKFRVSVWDLISGTIIEGHFNTLLNDEIARSGRYNRPFSLVQVHIDGIEDFADVASKEDVKAVYQAIGKRLIKIMRDVDVVGRKGEFDFILILPETKIIGGETAAKRIIEDISNMKIMLHSGLSHQFSLSIGAVQFPVSGKDADALYVSLESNLVQAKKLGGDRVVFSH